MISADLCSLMLDVLVLEFVVWVKVFKVLKGAVWHWKSPGRMDSII